MSNPWRVLGLKRGADRREVRRAYAVKLRVTNPEDDPDGFKRLREAYEAVLAQLDHQERRAAMAGPDDVEDVADEPEQDEPEDADPETTAAPVIDEFALAEQARRSEEIGSLEQRTQQLAQALAGDGPREDDAVERIFAAMMREPAVERIDIRSGVEFWLADLMARTVPRSDAILTQAIAAFGWESGHDRHRRHPAISAMLDRMDEWRLLSAMKRREHPLHDAYMALTVPLPEWRMRLLASNSGLLTKVRKLLALAEYEAPGIVHSFRPELVTWWRARLEQGPPFQVGRLIPPAIGIGVAALMVVLLQPFNVAFAWGIAALPLIAGVAFALLRRHADALRDRVQRTGNAVRESWAPLILFWPLVLILMPPTPVAVGIGMVGSIAVMAWMLTAREGQPVKDEVNPIGLIFSLGIFGLVGGIGAMEQPPLMQALLAMAALVVLATRWIGMIDLATWMLRRMGAWVLLIVGGTIVAMGVMLVSLAPGLPWAPSSFVVGSALVAFGMPTWSAAYRADGGRIRFVPSIGRVVMTLFFLAMLGDSIVPEGKGPASADAPPAATAGRGEAEASDVPTASDVMMLTRTTHAWWPDREAAMIGIRANDPGLADRIDTAVREARRPFGTSARDRLDRMLQQAYVARRKQASNALIAEDYRLQLRVAERLAKTDVAACADGRLNFDYGEDPVLDARFTRLQLAMLSRPPATAAELAEAKPITERAFEDRQEELGIKQVTGDHTAARCQRRIDELRVLTAFPDPQIAATHRGWKTSDAKAGQEK